MISKSSCSLTWQDLCSSLLLVIIIIILNFFIISIIKGTIISLADAQPFGREWIGCRLASSCRPWWKSAGLVLFLILIPILSLILKLVKNLPRLNKRVFRMPKIQVSKINCKIKSILSGLVTGRLYFYEKIWQKTAIFPCPAETDPAICNLSYNTISYH